MKRRRSTSSFLMRTPQALCLIADSLCTFTQGFRSVYKPRRAGRGFAELLDAVAAVDPELRVRFTSPHPKDFSDDVIDVRFLCIILRCGPCPCRPMLLSWGDSAWRPSCSRLVRGLRRLCS